MANHVPAVDFMFGSEAKLDSFLSLNQNAEAENVSHVFKQNDRPSESVCCEGPGFGSAG